MKEVAHSYQRRPLADIITVNCKFRKWHELDADQVFKNSWNERLVSSRHTRSVLPCIVVFRWHHVFVIPWQAGRRTCCGEIRWIGVRYGSSDGTCKQRCWISLSCNPGQRRRWRSPTWPDWNNVFSTVNLSSHLDCQRDRLEWMKRRRQMREMLSQPLQHARRRSSCMLH